MRGVAFLPEAREELGTATAYYDGESPGLGDRFLGSVEQVVNRIAAFPEQGSPFLGGTRRVVLRRFPFSVVYLQEAERVLVVAVAHTSRRPGYWRDRF